MSGEDVRLARLRADLRTDRALSLTQAETHYQLRQVQLEAAGFFVFERRVGVTRHAKARPCAFVAAEEAVLDLRGQALRHLVGVAELRHRLGAEAKAWRSAADAAFALLRPDAVWQTPEGVIAIEFDAGSYDPEQLRRKVEAFGSFAGQVWGAASRARAAHLSRFLEVATNDALALHVRWS